jgi:IclR family transcriptional regulator, acetate operon repressor
MPKQIQSLERGLYILEAILYAPEPVTSGDIARRLGVHKSTVSHLAATLVRQGYLCKSLGSAKLAPGPAVFRLSRAAGPSVDVITAARPFVEKLADTTGETAHLAELRGKHAYYLANYYSKMALRVQTETGMFEDLHSTAVGKALLSGLSDDEVRGIYSGVAMKRFTLRTITDIRKLLRELNDVRKRGVAFDREEQTVGTGCLASPVRGKWGQVVAAVGVSGPVGRVFNDETSHEASVIKCAGDIEKDMKKKGCKA